MTDHNGLRWTWSSYPNTAKAARSNAGLQALEKVVGQVSGSADAGDAHHIPLPHEMVVPLAAMYTPLFRDPASEFTQEGHLFKPSNNRIVFTDASFARCSNCGTYLSRAAHVDTSFWACPSCQHRMPLPQDFSIETHPSLQADTVEYVLPAMAAQGGAAPAGFAPHSAAIPVFLFVLDVAIAYDELEALKQRLLATLDKLPPNAHVGLITSGRNVTVWDLACNDLNRCYSIRGNRPYIPSGGQTSAAMNLITSALSTVGGGSSSPASPVTGSGMGGSNAGHLLAAVNSSTPSTQYLRSCLMIHANSPALGRFLCPLDDCEFALTSILEELSVDPFPVPTGFRPERATGTALDAAVTLMETVSVDVSAKILLFAGGPATRGPGAVVSLKKDEMLRSHHDFQNGDCPHYEKAVLFYTDIEKRLCAAGTSLDVFVASFDQIGILELRTCVNHTGGSFICVDTFLDKMFTESLSRFFSLRDFSGSKSGAALAKIQEYDSAAVVAPALCGYNAQLTLYTSRDTLVSGVVGPCRALAPPGSAPSPTSPTPENKFDRPTTNISSIVVGQGGTQSWRVSCLDPNLTLTFIFDTATLDEAPTSTTSHRSRFFQFVTSYTTISGERRIRVTSVGHHVSPSAEPTFFVNNSCFDQTCAATVTSRMAVSTLEDYTPMSWGCAKRWLDKLLVTFVRRFGTYQVGRPESLRLSPTMSLFPSFMYNLRRSEYFMQMNISPDETVFKRHWLMREPCDMCVLMIQPTLHSYTLSEPMAVPVPLDSNSILPDNILVIDCFFNLHVIWGQVVYEWMKLEYHKQPEYAHLAALLDAPTHDTQAVLARRFPYPRFSETDINGGESRHLKTRLNPSSTYQDKQPSAPGLAPPAQGGAFLNTDDASVAKFMTTLKEAVVRQDTKASSTLGH